MWIYFARIRESDYLQFMSNVNGEGSWATLCQLKWSRLTFSHQYCCLNNVFNRVFIDVLQPAITVNLIPWYLWLALLQLNHNMVAAATTLRNCEYLRCSFNENSMVWKRSSIVKSFASSNWSKLFSKDHTKYSLNKEHWAPDRRYWFIKLPLINHVVVTAFTPEIFLYTVVCQILVFCGIWSTLTSISTLLFFGWTVVCIVLEYPGELPTLEWARRDDWSVVEDLLHWLLSMKLQYTCRFSHYMFSLCENT